MIRAEILTEPHGTVSTPLITLVNPLWAVKTEPCSHGNFHSTLNTKLTIATKST